MCVYYNIPRECEQVNMVTTRSIAQYRKVWRGRIRAIERASKKSSLQAASYQVAQAKSMAPRKSGVLRGNIKKRKRKNGWVAESWVPGNFKYNFWVNKNIGRVKLPTRAFIINGKLKWPRRATRKRLGIETPRSYSSTNHTGTPGYWNIAISRTRKRFANIAKKNTRKALRVST